MMATKDATLMMLPPRCRPFSGSALFCEERLSDEHPETRGTGTKRSDWWGRRMNKEVEG